MDSGAAPRLAAFHAGDRSVLEECYRDQYRSVVAAISRLLRGADAETVTHEVFYRLLSDARLRENFQGGNFPAWLTQVATNAARDFLRRYRREQPELSERAPADDSSPAADALEANDAKLAIDRFRRERLPPELAPLFEARFVRQLSQRDAALELGMPRSTLAYQEERLRSVLKDFLLRGAS